MVVLAVVASTGVAVLIAKTLAEEIGGGVDGIGCGVGGVSGGWEVCRSAGCSNGW